MSRATDLMGGIRKRFDEAIDAIRPYRATAYAVSGGRVQIKQFEADTEFGELSAQLRGFDVQAGDEILVIDVAGRPFVLGAVQRTAPTSLAVSAPINGSSFMRSGSGAASANTTSTTVYTNLSNWSVTLPSGTWQCAVLAQASLQHSASGNANFRVSVGGTAGTVQTQSFFNAAYATGVCDATVTGLSGTVSINFDFKSSAAGTTTCKNAGYIAWFSRQ